jgi:hypothetical protein
MAIITTPPTTPPTIAPVFKSPPPESDDAGEEEDEAGKPVVDGAIVPEELVVEEVDPLINTPGPISGVSTKT